ncbi:hypothetical protein BGZ81_010934 [Podila clonocystis]|nr:hypothetical protein BGZ81_010934 [Podila clonocystis]
MQYKAPSPWMRYFTLLGALLLVLVFAPSAAQANTEKVIFTVNHATDDVSSAGPSNPGIDDHDSERYHGIDPTQWKHLSSPHTIIQQETIVPSFYADDVTIAHRMASPPSEDGEEDPLLQEAIGGGDLQNREYKWYALDALSQGASFELRISYPATSPADFDMSVWTMTEAQKHVPRSIQLIDHFNKDTMFARIKATYTGVSYRAGPESKLVPYNLVLERLYMHIPYQALKLAAVIAVAVVGGLGVLVPRLHGYLQAVASGKEKSS